MCIRDAPDPGCAANIDLELRKFRNMLNGEVAERSKALDWNSSNIFTGVRGFESHPLRQRSMVVRACSFAMTCREPRQARKGAAAAVRLCAEVRLVRTASLDC
jgi:hypothetical protein